MELMFHPSISAAAFQMTLNLWFMSLAPGNKKWGEGGKSLFHALFIVDLS